MKGAYSNSKKVIFERIKAAQKHFVISMLRPIDQSFIYFKSQKLNKSGNKQDDLAEITSKVMYHDTASNSSQLRLEQHMQFRPSTKIEVNVLTHCMHMFQMRDCNRRKNLITLNQGNYEFCYLYAVKIHST